MGEKSQEWKTLSLNRGAGQTSTGGAEGHPQGYPSYLRQCRNWHLWGPDSTQGTREEGSRNQGTLTKQLDDYGEGGRDP